ncbi:MAG: GNAT family N-acetyltransferase [Myroides sp.]|jgi:ribosomal protein S18 acetylase RimI-like enzyme|nr:GNAT family N-acetyltransferase [Myroides sp.]
MQIITLENVDKALIHQVINDSFADYIEPFSLTLEQLEFKIYAEQVDLSLSVGVQDNGRLVAFILHGIQSENNHLLAYNGGTGVILEYRKQGLVQKMYAFLEPVFQQRKVKRIILEVIQENIAAISSYQRLGFTVSRRFNCYDGILRQDIQSSQTFDIRPLSLIKWAEVKPFWDITPGYQCSESLIEQVLDKVNSLGVYVEDKLVGYIVFNQLRHRIYQLAVDSNYRNKGYAKALLGEVAQVFNQEEISVNNVDKRSIELNALLKSFGLVDTVVQLEMERVIE